MDHTLVLLSDGSLWANGLNQFGQLSRDDYRESVNPVRPVRLRTFTRGALGGFATVRAVAAGGFHSLVLLDTGVCMAMGMGGNGQLGRGTRIFKERTPQQVRFPRDVRVRSIFAGVATSGFVVRADTSTTVDELFLCGSNSYGSLGVGDCKDRLVPTRVELPNVESLKIVDGATGSEHTMVVLDDGRVFAFGRNLESLCGIGHAGLPELQRLTRPIQVESLANVRVRRVSLGVRHSVVLSDDGRVFGTGLNIARQLAGIEESSISVFRPFEFPEQFRGTSATRIACGKRATIVLFSNGTSIICGQSQVVPVTPAWSLDEWSRDRVSLKHYPLKFRVALRYAILVWRSPRESQQRVWRRAGVGHVPLRMLLAMFTRASLPLAAWDVGTR